MNEHAGASCALSVLIVGVFAVLLYERDHPPRILNPSAKSAANAQEIHELASIPPGPSTPPVRFVVMPTSQPGPMLVTVPERSSVIETASRQASPIGRVEQKPVAKVRRSTERVVPRKPKSGYAVVEPGETLADLSIRIYGTANLADSVFKANRDQISRPDVSLKPGTLLRTP